MFGKSKKTEVDERREKLIKEPKIIAPDVPFPPIPGPIEDYQVKMLGPDDPDNPQKFSFGKKLSLLIGLSYSIMVAAWGSAICAPATPVLMKAFHVGTPVAALTVSLYVLGFAVGPIVWGPMASMYGRKLPLFFGCFGMIVFMFASATAKDYQTLTISRFFAGVFGASSLTVGPTVAGDVFSNETRGSSIVFVTFCVIAGPMIAPIVGGYIVQSFLGWRWTLYITGFMSSLEFFVILFAIPESHPPTLMKKRAQKMRRETGNWAITAPGELDDFSPKQFVKDVLLSPVKMLVNEVILGLVSIYHGFIYGILYMCLESVPIIFSGYGFPGANIYLPYISILTGAVTVCIVQVVVFERYYNKMLEKYNKPVLPELRLPAMILAGAIFTIGIFLMCWTGAYAKHVHWIVPMVGGAFVGYGIIGIFISAFNYILDTYLSRSANAFAANTFLRSAFGCAFPLFVKPMFLNLGTQWAGTLVGCLAALLFPVPIFFYIYGSHLRSISPFAINLEDLKKTDADVIAEEEGEVESEEDREAEGDMSPEEPRK